MDIELVFIGVALVLLFCVLFSLGIYNIGKALDRSVEMNVRLIDQSTVMMCNECGRVVNRRMMVDEFNECIYCVLDDDDLYREIESLSDTKRVVPAIAKPEED